MMLWNAGPSKGHSMAHVLAVPEATRGVGGPAETGQIHCHQPGTPNGQSKRISMLAQQARSCRSLGKLHCSIVANAVLQSVRWWLSTQFSLGLVFWFRWHCTQYIGLKNSDPLYQTISVTGFHAVRQAVVNCNRQWSILHLRLCSASPC